MAVTIDSTQIDYGTASDAGVIIFSEPFADTPAVVSYAGVSGVTVTGFTIAGPGGWVAIGPSKISRLSPV
jgi:hypothetical protein